MLHFISGNALAYEVFSHRHQWDGTICRGAETWDCGASSDFREDYCAAGIDRCYHQSLLTLQRVPTLILDEVHAGSMLQSFEETLRDQVLLLWARPGSEPFGISRERRQWLMTAVYRVERVVADTTNPRKRRFRVSPYADGWASLHPLRLDTPRFSEIDGSRLRQVEQAQLLRLVEVAKTKLESRELSATAAPHRSRIERALEKLPEWLSIARDRLDRAPPRTTGPIPQPSGGPRIGTPVLAASTKLTARKQATPAEPEPKKPNESNDVNHAPPAVAAASAPAIIADSAPAAPRSTQLIEPGARAAIVERYGADTLTALLVASVTKPFVILRGPPGVGKSHLALSLLVDPGGDRTLVVPVASTWRGRDDLLGYTNPVSNDFEPTAFTSFLRDAESAWETEDRRPRLVVFEEFNLSPPEQWLSEILVRSQYSPNSRRDRTIALGGARVRGWHDHHPSVFLSPALRFVATLNRDVAARPLSPRVLDRASVVDIALDVARVALVSGLTLPEDQLEALKDLDFRLQGTDATFSLRTAYSLKDCLAQADALGLQPWAIIDRIVVQEVLSKVRLLAGEPFSRETCDALGKWSEDFEPSLPECARTIRHWQAVLGAGRDVE